MRRPGTIAALVLLAAGAPAAVLAQTAGAVTGGAELAGAVEPGSVVNEARIRIVNDDAAPLGGVQARARRVPGELRNLVIEPERIELVAPGTTADFTLTFDVASDAPAGVLPPLELEVTAAEGALETNLAHLTIEVLAAPPAIDRVDAGGQTAADPPGASSRTLKLVRIEGPDPFAAGDTEVGFTEDSPGYWSRKAVRASAGGEVSRSDLSSVWVKAAPLTFELGEPFEFTAEVETRSTYQPAFDCTGVFQVSGADERGWQGPAASAGTGSAWDTRSAIRVTGGDRLDPSRCFDGDRYQRWLADAPGDSTLGATQATSGLLEFAVRFLQPAAADGLASGGLQYRLEVSAPAAAYVRAEETALVADTGFRFAVRGPDGGDLVLVYLPVDAPEPAIASLAPFGGLPPDVTVPAPPAVADAGPAGPGGDGADGAPEAGGGGGAGTADAGPGDPSNPAAINPASAEVAALIRTWIDVAEPPENATELADLRYSARGAKIGTTRDGGVVRATHDENAPFDPTFLWNNRGPLALDSIDHCTLEEFVLAGVAGAGRPAECVGRYARAVITPDVSAQAVQSVQNTFVNLGLLPRFQLLGPAPTPEEADTVAAQDPAAGRLLPPGAEVRLSIYSGYEAPLVAVPDLIGMSPPAAVAALEAAGLVPAPRLRGPAPREDLAERVAETDPAAGLQVETGTEVRLDLYGTYEIPLVAVPNVAGMVPAEAIALIRDAGLTPAPELLGPAPRADLSERVAGTRPAAGSELRAGATVGVRLYAAYVPPAPPPDPPRPPPAPPRAPAPPRPGAGLCDDLIARGNQASARGRYQEAIAWFREAAGTGCTADPPFDEVIADLEDLIRTAARDEQDRVARCGNLLALAEQALAAGDTLQANIQGMLATASGCDTGDLLPRIQAAGRNRVAPPPLPPPAPPAAPPRPPGARQGPACEVEFQSFGGGEKYIIEYEHRQRGRVIVVLTARGDADRQEFFGRVERDGNRVLGSSTSPNHQAAVRTACGACPTSRNIQCLELQR